MIISIDGIDLPDPYRYSLPEMDLHSPDTGRLETGYLQIDRVRQGIYKIELSFRVKSPDLALIKSAIEPPEFNVTFLTEVGYKTKKMYVGDRKTEILRFRTTVDEIWWQIDFNLIEL